MQRNDQQGEKNKPFSYKHKRKNDSRKKISTKKEVTKRNQAFPGSLHMKAYTILLTERLFT